MSTTDPTPTPTPAQPLYPNVVVQLTGEDGNAFNIIGRTAAALSREVSSAAATAYSEAAFESDSYDALLRHTMRTVTVR